MNLSKKQAAYLKDRGPLSVHKTLSDKLIIPAGESTRFKDTKGNLTFDMDICRDGVQEYQAQEIFDADLLKQNQISPDTTIRVWRPPNVVFDPAAVKSHNGKSLTRNHPNTWVDEGNRSSLEKGIARGCWHDPQKRVISGTGFVSDPQMVAEIESGEFGEISDGYDSELDFEPGVVPESIDNYPCTDAGSDYDMVMTSYKPNHIAIVPEGRAGNARILDEKGVKKMGFFEKIARKKAIKEIRTMDRATVLRMLADEEPDEEKKATLEALAEDECGSEVTDASEETGGSGPDGMVYGGVDTSGIQEFDTSGAEVDEEEARENVLNEDGSSKRITDSKEVENMKTEELKALMTEVMADQVPKLFDAAMKQRFGDGQDITLDDDDDLFSEEGEEEYIGDDEAQAIGVAEEWEEPETPGETEPETPGEVEPESQDAVPEMQGPTPEQLQKWAAGTTDPEAKRMFMALSEKVAGMDAEPEVEEVSETEETVDAGFMDIEGDLEENRLEAAASGKPAPAGPPSNQVSDGDKASDPVVEQNGYFVPKKLTDSDGETAKLLLDSVEVVDRYGLTGIDKNKHAADGTIYHRIIDASGIIKVKKPDDITRSILEMSINAIKNNRQMIDGMSSIAGKVRDAQTSVGFNPEELY